MLVHYACAIDAGGLLSGTTGARAVRGIPGSAAQPVVVAELKVHQFRLPEDLHRDEHTEEAQFAYMRSLRVPGGRHRRGAEQQLAGTDGVLQRSPGRHLAAELPVGPLFGVASPKPCSATTRQAISAISSRRCA